MIKRAFVLLLALNLIFLLCACGQSESSRQVYVMDSAASLRVFPANDEAINAMCDTLFEIDRELSATNGELFEINENSGGNMPRHMAEVLSLSLKLAEKTGGAFSPCLGAVIDLWGVGSKNYVPTERELQTALRVSDVSGIELFGDEIALRGGARLSFGAIAKGYASDVMRDMLLQNGVESALISLGGNVYVHGKKPDGGMWNVAIRDPAGGANDWLGSLALSDKFVISSGDYERFFESGGKRYHHIIDPKTGAPAESDLTAVCVVGESGSAGDAYSTALYVMGREAALSFWRENGGFELVLIGRDARVTVTEGIADAFTPNEGKGYTYETAYR